MKKNAIIIPTYNEGLSISKSIQEISEFLLLEGHGTVAILIDDGSTDNTYEQVTNLALPNVHAFKLPSNQGYGGAIRFGFEIAMNHQIKNVVVMDSDLTNPLDEVPRMFKEIENADLVKASRFIEGSDMSNVSKQRKIFSILGNLILRKLFNSEVLDVTNGFRAWRVNSYLGLPRTSPGFSSIVEEFYFAKKSELRIREIPTRLGNRTEAQRKTSASYSMKSIWLYLRPGIYYFVQKHGKIQIQPEFHKNAK